MSEVESKPKRILQVGMSSNYGGTESIIYSIYERLNKSRVQFDFLNVYEGPLAKQSWLESMGAHIYDLKLKRRDGFAKYIKSIKDFYNRNACEWAVVVCNVQSLEQLDMAKYAKKMGIRTIVHCHNSGFGIRPSFATRLLSLWNKCFCGRYVDSYLACSYMAARWALGKRKAEKAYILKNGISPSAFSFHPEERRVFRQRFGFRENEVIYANAGRMDLQKNQSFFVRVCAQLAIRNKDARFVLLGRGAEEATLKEEVLRLGLEARFLFIEQIESMSEFYSGVDCFIFPSLFEGLGMVLIEAQCSGLPCFASSKTIPPEVGFSPFYHPLSLQAGVESWALTILKTPLNQNRDGADAYLGESGRTIEQCAAEYQRIVSV